MEYHPINEHGLIGDLHTAGLVNVSGELVWLPWPRFDSPSLFAGILDCRQGGHWSLAPTKITGAAQRYDGESALLLTSSPPRPAGLNSKTGCRRGRGRLQSMTSAESYAAPPAR
jgi:hypothetical protein